MNNRPVEQALAKLLPTHANELPEELLSLSLSLVAQSRSFSTSLRPEEEIARPYACAELACKRLRRTLKLPPLLGNPPCPPNAYKKLLSFLDRSLSANVAVTRRSGSNSASATPSRTRQTPATPSKHSPAPQSTPSKPTPTRQRPQNNTPTKSTPLKRSLSHASTPDSRRKSTKIRPNGLPPSTAIADAPAWAMNSIRTVCKTLSTPAPRTNTFSRPPVSKTLPPHIFAGVSSVLYFIGSSFQDAGEELDEETLEFLEPVLLTKDLENADEVCREVIYALIVAVYFLVLARRRNPSHPDEQGEEGGNYPASATADSRKMDKKTFAEMRQTALVSLGLPSSEHRHRDDVDQWIALVMEQGWVGGKEWFENIPQAGELDGDDAYLSGEDALEDDYDDYDGRKGMATGLGSILSKDAARGGLLPGWGL
ncbi:hypothetical protein PHISP_06757 [Aspergillus sp. HF37]|nr:hypothetical protein PHISP_06757 [Aspergillus sp. HF37]